MSTKRPDGKVLTDTDVAQGVEQVVYERMKDMEANGEFTTRMTNGQRPVNMDNPNKVFREQAGREWLMNKYGSEDAYNKAIDEKIRDHYNKVGLCGKS